MVKSIAGGAKFSGVSKKKNKGFAEKPTPAEPANNRYFDDEVSDDDTNGNIAIASGRKRDDSDEEDDEVFNLNGDSDSDEDDDEEDSGDSEDDSGDSEDDDLENDDVSFILLNIFVFQRECGSKGMKIKIYFYVN